MCKNKIKDFLQKYDLNNPQNTYLVGFSGGADSMCLLNSLKETCPENKIIALHLNHNWRGEESDREEQNCADFCKKIGVEFYSEKLTSDIAQNETSARTERYKFFEKCAKKFNSNIIFTAHNKNDNIETIIFRICHGTGISGLSGISKKREIYYRPMLNISREEIEKYCNDNNLKPNIDSSNFDTVHKRNLIRAEILPLLKKINPSAPNAIQSLIEIATEETEIIQEYTKDVINKISDNNKIQTKKFLKLSEALQKRILYEIITPNIPEDYDKKRLLILWNFIKENANSKSGKTISVTTDLWLFVSKKNIELINRKEKDNFCIKITKAGEYKYGRYTINISECNRIPEQGYGNSSSTVFVDLSTLAPLSGKPAGRQAEREQVSASYASFTAAGEDSKCKKNLSKSLNLEFRHRFDGDIIQPLGMLGTQKLKKYLNSKKIPNHEKDDLLFLARGNEILWAIGLGLSEKIRVKTNPTHKIKVIKED